jgi:hypothetical protein
MGSYLEAGDHLEIFFVRALLARSDVSFSVFASHQWILGGEFRVAAEARVADKRQSKATFE